MRLYLFCFIVFSFFVGLGIGFSRKGPVTAYAAKTPAYDAPVGVHAISALHLNRVGESTSVSQIVSEMYSFTTDLSVENALVGQEQRWKERGFKTSRVLSENRGVLLGVASESSEIYQAVAFFCPPEVRERLCGGEKVFGMISRMQRQSRSEESGLGRDSLISIQSICSGGNEISNFTSSDLGRPTVTTTVRCPAMLDSVKSETLQNFGCLGWDARELGESVLLFSKGAEELNVIYSQSGAETYAVLTHVRGKL
jgi:hypothetical protein